MPELQFSVESISPDDAAPGLTLRLRIENSLPQEQIQSVALNIQLQIQPGRRRYTSDEKAALKTLFGEPKIWHKSLRPLFWANVLLNVPTFVSSTVADFNLPCSSSGNDAAIAFCSALQEGEIPLDLLFSGTVLYRVEDSLQAAFIPWSKEAAYKVPVVMWRESMALPRPSITGTRLCFDQPQSAKPVWEEILAHARTAAGKMKL
jgi:hypothetical protein